MANTQTELDIYELCARKRAAGKSVKFRELTTAQKLVITTLIATVAETVTKEQS
jgi:hypothetical protein